MYCVAQWAGGMHFAFAVFGGSNQTMPDHASSCRLAMLLGSFLGVTACAKELTPDEVEALVNEQFNASDSRV